MKGLLVGAAGIFALLLSSCMDLKTSEQLDSIAAMNKTIDSLETVFNENKLDSVAKISLSAYSIDNRIKKYYVSDTINMEFGKKMDAFKVMRRNLAPIGKAQQSIPQSIEEERTKLKELQTDIENGDGKREEYDKYIAFEQDKVKQLKSLVTEYIQVKDASLKTYNDLHDELYAFSMSLFKQ